MENTRSTYYVNFPDMLNASQRIMCPLRPPRPPHRRSLPPVPVVSDLSCRVRPVLPGPTRPTVSDSLFHPRSMPPSSVLRLPPSVISPSVRSAGATPRRTPRTEIVKQPDLASAPRGTGLKRFGWCVTVQFMLVKALRHPVPVDAY